MHAAFQDFTGRPRPDSSGSRRERGRRVRRATPERGPGREVRDDVVAAAVAHDPGIARGERLLHLRDQSRYRRLDSNGDSAGNLIARLKCLSGSVFFDEVQFL